MVKPIMLMRGGLTNRIYAVRRYKELAEGNYVVVGGAKDDVTVQAIGLVREHVEECRDQECPCMIAFRLTRVAAAGRRIRQRQSRRA